MEKPPPLRQDCQSARLSHLTPFFHHTGLVDIVPHCHLSAALITGAFAWAHWRPSRPLTSSICQTAVITHWTEVLEHEHGHGRHDEQHHEHHDPDVSAEGLWEWTTEGGGESLLKNIKHRYEQKARKWTWLLLFGCCSLILQILWEETEKNLQNQIEIPGKTAFWKTYFFRRIFLFINL